MPEGSIRPTDPRVLRQLRAARGPLLAVTGSAILAGVLVIAQAWAVTGLVLAALDRDAVATWAAVVLGLLALRGLTGAVTDLAAARAASAVATDLRGRAARA
ncbi:ABC transporter permease, partial [Nocardioides sp. YIM 152588]